MSLRLGTIDPADLRLGAVDVAKVYRGAAQVWPVGGGGPTTPPTFVAANSAATSGTSLAVPMPAGRAAGDLLLVMTGRGVGGAAPAGWSVVDQFTNAGTVPQSVAVYSKISNGSEGSTTFTTVGGLARIVGISVAYRGVGAVPIAQAVRSSLVEVDRTVNLVTNPVTRSTGQAVVHFVGHDSSAGDTASNADRMTAAEPVVLLREASSAFSNAAWEQPTGTSATFTDVTDDSVTNHTWAAISLVLNGV